MSSNTQKVPTEEEEAELKKHLITAVNSINHSIPSSNTMIALSELGESITKIVTAPDDIVNVLLNVETEQNNKEKLQENQIDAAKKFLKDILPKNHEISAQRSTEISLAAAAHYLSEVTLAAAAHYLSKVSLAAALHLFTEENLSGLGKQYQFAAYFLAGLSISETNRLEILEIEEDILKKILQESIDSFQKIRKEEEAKEEEKELQWKQRFAAACIRDKKNKIPLSEDERKILANTVQHNPLENADNIKKKTTFFETKKRNEILKAIENATKKKDQNSYNKIIWTASNIFLLEGEKKEALNDRINIIMNERYPEPEKGRQDQTYSTEKLKNRVKHLIKYDRPQTADEKGIFSFGPLSIPPKKTELNFFEDKGFNYEKYFKKCETEFEKVIEECTSKITVKMRENIARLICHTLLKIQNQPTPGLAPTVADAIAKKLCQTAAGKEFKILEACGAIKELNKEEEKYSQLYFAARDNNISPPKTESKTSGNELISQFLSHINPPEIKSYSFTLYRPYYKADGIISIEKLACKIKDPEIFFKAAKSIAQGRIERFAWRDPETTRIYQALVESDSLQTALHNLPANPNTQPKAL